MSQTHFRPVNEDHAIVEQMVFFQFAPPLEGVMPALLTLKEELRNDLPQSDFLKSLHVNFVDNKPSSQEIRDAAGIVLYKSASNGSREWMINLSPESISIHCTVYTRWDDIWPVYEKYLGSIFPKISGSQSFLTAVGTRWVDQFRFDGNEAEYNALELLRDGSPYLSGSAFNSGTRWHCHTGWFDSSAVKGFEVLNQLNVDSGRINDAGHLRTAVTFDHTQQLRADQRIDQLADFLPTTAPGLVALSGLMDTLHDGNKRVLRSVLNDSSCGRIGLELGQLG